MTFWANYVILKEKEGIDRATTLSQIETKYGLNKRQEIENDLNNQ
ncbi:hypothetical protein [Sporosalibacterium faouarense]|nr:hypothetical protein [Sporosalibacterium faouarense]